MLYKTVEELNMTSLRSQWRSVAESLKTDEKDSIFILTQWTGIGETGANGVSVVRHAAKGNMEGLANATTLHLLTVASTAKDHSDRGVPVRSSIAQVTSLFPFFPIKWLSV